MAGINKFLNVVIILGCVVIAYFFYQAKLAGSRGIPSRPQAVEQSSVKPTIDPQDLANRYLQQAQQNLMAEKVKAEINIKKAIAESQRPAKVTETDPSQVPIEQQIWKDQPAEKSASLPDITPKNSGEIDKQEYIRQFKENARKNGYEITVNDDLEVTSVTPIRKPQNSKTDYDSNQNSETEY